jgi:hypothetical protein
MASEMDDGSVAWRISCDDCAMAATSACDDCLVTHLCTADEPRAVVLDLEEFRAVRKLQEAGLVPRNRHRLGPRRALEG